MPTTLTTKEFTITLPLDTATYVEKRIAEGDFKNASDYFETLTVSELFVSPSEDELVHWMNTEGARRLQELHADPSSGLTIDQAFAGLIEEEDV